MFRYIDIAILHQFDSSKCWWSLLSTLKHHSSFQVIGQERKDGPHKPSVHRDGDSVDPESLPPGCSCAFGYPEAANPFIQIKLPNGMQHLKKKSRAVSYIGSDGSSKRGTMRTRDNALSCVTSWAWTWWNSLTNDERSCIRNSMSSKRSRSASADSSRSKRIKPWSHVRWQFLQSHFHIYVLLRLQLQQEHCLQTTWIKRS